MSSEAAPQAAAGEEEPPGELEATAAGELKLTTAEEELEETTIASVQLVEASTWADAKSNLDGGVDAAVVARVGMWMGVGTRAAGVSPVRTALRGVAFRSSEVEMDLLRFGFGWSPVGACPSLTLPSVS